MLMPISLSSRHPKASERALLETVGDTYSKLKSLTVDITITDESDDGAVFNHRQKRARAQFSAPDGIRIDQGGRRGAVMMTTGIDVQHYLYFGGKVCYLKNVVKGSNLLPGRFRPDYPHAPGITFLFSRIAEWVSDVITLREEPDREDGEAVCQVLSVTYTPPAHTGLVAASSPLLFWVNSRTNLISRMEIETVHPLAGDDGIQTNKLILAYHGAMVDEPIAARNFEYTPAMNPTTDWTADTSYKGAGLSFEARTY